jgi:hypothetical protein
MSAFSKLVVWVCVGCGVIITYSLIPRAATELRQGLAVLVVGWLLLSCLWFARTLFRFVVR